MTEKQRIDQELERVNNELLLKQSGEILQAIYDSEINFSIFSPCWDGGFSIRLGGWQYPDDQWQHLAEKIDGESKFVDAVRCLVEAVWKHYPDSTFTEKYRPLLKGII